MWRMLRLTLAQRRIVQEKLPDLANLAVATAVFGQMVSGQPFSIRIASAGIGIWLTLMLVAFYSGDSER